MKLNDYIASLVLLLACSVMAPANAESSFTFDAADRIVPYQGDCKEVDGRMGAQKR